MAYFNSFGWYTDEVLEGRMTTVEPKNKSVTETEGELRANWSGYEWFDIPYTKPYIYVFKDVPERISARQARLILLQNNLLDDIELLLANDKALQIWWEYSIEIERDNNYLVQAASQLGITDEQLDAMFIEASKL